MNEIAVYMNAVNAMEDLCLRQEPSLIYTWSLPQYDLTVDLTSQVDPQYRFSAWGLQMTVVDAIERGFTPLIVTFFWRGVRKGVVQINYRLLSDHIDGPSVGDASLEAIDMASNMLNGTSKPPFQTPYQIEIRPTYNGVSMSAREIFQIALDVMVAGSEQGINTPVDHNLGSYFMVWTARRDPQTGQPLLRWRQVIKAMKLLTRWMVALDHFGEVDVEILKAGDSVARIRLQQPADAAVQ